MNYRKAFAVTMAFLGGSYFFLQFVLPDQIFSFDLQKYHSQISDGFTLVGTMTIGLGLISLLLNHGGRLLAKRQGWINSLALLIGLFLMLSVSIWDWRMDYASSSKTQEVLKLKAFAETIQGDFIAKKFETGRTLERTIILANAVEQLLQQQKVVIDQVRPILGASRELKELSDSSAQVALASSELRGSCSKIDSCISVLEKFPSKLSDYSSSLRLVLESSISLSTGKQLYRLLFEGIFISLGSAIFSLLGFYIVTAAFRAFRVRSWESGLMMIAALLVMFGQISVGLWLWPHLAEIRLWLLETPNSAAFRAIDIGTSVAGLVLAFRMWFSIESKSFSGTD